MTCGNIHALFSVTQKTRIAPAPFQEDLQPTAMLLAFEKHYSAVTVAPASDLCMEYPCFSLPS